MFALSPIILEELALLPVGGLETLFAELALVDWFKSGNIAEFLQ